MTQKPPDDRARILHDPVHDVSNPAVNLNSPFRPARCRPTTSSFANIANQKILLPPPPRSDQYSVRLGYNYRQAHQAYYTDNPDEVNCQSCLRKRARLGNAGVRGLRERMAVLLARQEKLAREIADLARKLARLESPTDAE